MRTAMSVFRKVTLLFTICFLVACNGDSRDTAPPIVTLLGESVIELFVGQDYVDPGATATDNRDENVSVFSYGVVDTSVPGRYLVNYSAVDSSGNRAENVTRTVIVLPSTDVTPPVITLNGEAEITILLGEEYIEAGATANDNLDENVEVVISGNVDTSMPGRYEVNYDATDSAGNSALTIVRVVNVQLPPDTTAPVITLLGADNITVFQGDTFQDPGATAADDRDGEVLVTVSGIVDTNIIGEYVLTYNAEDMAGNQANPVTRIVNVVLPPDTTAPVITLNGDALVTVLQGEVYQELGATAEDDRDGIIDVSISGTVDTSSLGDYTITYSAQDSAGNRASATRIVSVVLPPDVTAPVITLLGDASITLEVGQTYEEAGATAVDDRDGEVTVTISGEVDTNTAGEYFLTYNAQDAAGNQATPVTRTVTVVQPAPLTLESPGDFQLAIGTELNFTLTTTGDAADTISYSASPIPLPANSLFDSVTGEFSFSPAADQAGSYTITFSVTDGVTTSSQTSNITVNEISPDDATQFSGRLLDANAFEAGDIVPIVNVTVSLLNSNPVQTTVTDAQGFFEFSNVDVVDQVLDLNPTDAQAAPDGSIYAGFREKIEFVANTTNVISRPFYLPRIAGEDLTPVDPSQTTVVTNSSLGVSMTVPPNTAVNGDGSLFTGSLSISEVPDGFAPAALPRSFRPADLVTVQPVGVRFTTPVPITFPNTDNLPAGTEVDIWSIDPDLGEFIVVGVARVSNDGAVLETISGGIVAADWHFPSPRQAEGTTAVSDENNENIDSAGSDTGCIGSSASLQGGCLKIAHDLVSYRSLDVQRGIRLSYSSETASPHPTINVGSTLDNQTAIPEAFQIKLNKVAGITQQKSQFVAAQRSATRHAIQFNATEIPTGAYPYEIEIANEYEVSGVSTFLMDTVIVHNQANSPIGSGWTIDGLQRVYPINGSDRVVITEGNDAIRLFTPQDENGDRNTDLIIAIDGSGSVSSSEFTLQLNGIAAAIENPLNVPHNGSASFGLVQFSRFAEVEIPLTVIDSTETAQALATQVRAIRQNGGGTDMAAAINESVQEFLTNAREDSRQVLILSTDGRPNSASNALAAANSAISQGVDEISAIGIGSGADLEFLETLVRSGTVFGVSDFNQFANSVGQNLRVIVGGSPAGEFSFVRRNNDNSLTRTMKDGTLIEFNSAGLQTALIDRNGNTTLFIYNSNEQLTSITDPVGLVINLAYENEKLTTITMPDGRVTNFSHDESGNLIEIQDPDSSTRKFNYSEQHLLTSQESKRGFTTQYVYDHQNRVVSSVWPDGSTRAISPSQTAALVASPENTSKALPAPSVGENDVLTQFTDGVGNDTSYVTDRFGRITRMTDAIGRVTVMERDVNGQVTELTRPNGAVVRYSYDQNGNLLTQLEVSNNAQTLFTYEPTFNLVTSVTDAAGNQTIYSYDEKGNLITVTDALGNSQTFTYNARGQILTETDELGNITTYSYDENGNVSTITDAIGGVNTYLYDDSGNVNSITDTKNNATIFTYDANNRLTAVTDPSGATTTTAYDAEGNVTSVTNPTGETVTTVYDSLSRPTEVSHPITGKTTTVYDGNGRITSITNAKSQVTSYAYDEANQLLTVTNALGHVETFTYDTLGNLETASDAKGNTTRFSYDLLGRVAERRDPTSQVERYAYDINNNLASTRTRNGGLIANAYDALNRVIQTQTSYDGFAVDNTYSYSYDAAGNAIGISDADSSFSYSYDALNRLIAETVTYDASTDQARSTTLTHTLDSEGNRTAIASSAHSLSINYQFDNRNLLSELTTHLGKTVTFGYDAAARMTSSDFGNGSSSTYSFDTQGRLDSIQHAGLRNLNLTYSYDELGNIVGIIEPNRIRNFQYDAIQQLLSGGTGTTPESYTYDEAYNRITSHSSSSNSHDANNRLTEDDRFTYSYDSNGNLTQKTETAASLTTTYTWDPQNQLIEVQDGTNTISYAYDALGRRIGKTVNGERTDYFYDGSHILFEQNSAGELISLYHHGAQIDQVLVREDQTDSYYYFSDHLGSVRHIIREDQEVSNSYEYDAYGNIISQTGTAHNPFLFTGREYDAETGLYFYRARYYDSNAGRFISEDPLLFVDGLNVNAYVGNNPVNLSDPTGTTSGVFSSGYSGPSCSAGGNPPSSTNLTGGQSSSFSSFLDGLQLTLDVAGLTPAIGNFADVANAAISAARGDFVGAGLSLGAAIPGVGQGVTSAKLANKARNRLIANKAAGDAARDAIAARTGGKIEQTFRVSGGLRRVDVLAGSTAIESKVGRTSLNKRIRQELARDVKLLRSGQVDRVQWEFSKSAVTGKSGPTGPLRRKLEQFGIDIIE